MKVRVLKNNHFIPNVKLKYSIFYLKTSRVQKETGFRKLPDSKNKERNPYKTKLRTYIACSSQRSSLQPSNGKGECLGSGRVRVWVLRPQNPLEKCNNLGLGFRKLQTNSEKWSYDSKIRRSRNRKRLKIEMKIREKTKESRRKLRNLREKSERDRSQMGRERNETAEAGSSRDWIWVSSLWERPIIYVGLVQNKAGIS